MIVDNNFMRFINRNMKAIIFIILVLVACYVLLRIANSNIRKNNANKANQQVSVDNSKSELDKAIVSDSKVDSSETQTNTSLIKSFIDYCNQGLVESAYALLTDDCKKAMYSTVDEFKRDYVDRIFTEKRTYSLNSWITYNNDVTYKLALQGDILATGNTSGGSIEEYITVIQDNDTKKLSVNSYIRRESVNLMNDSGDISIIALNKDVYMDYEVYNFYVKNNTNSNVLLDTLEATDTIYLVGENDTEYTAYVNELDGAYVYLKPGVAKQISIKFNKMYNTNVRIKSINFINVVSNYDDYIAYSDYGHLRDEIKMSTKYTPNSN